MAAARPRIDSGGVILSSRPQITSVGMRNDARSGRVSRRSAMP
jgi:hypothetical protein